MGLTVAEKTTTIRITSKVRDELNALAESDGRSTAAMVAWLVEKEQGKRLIRQANEDFAKFKADDPEGWARYMAEFEAWEESATGNEIPPP
jgi:fructose-1,6-bisphosphatase/sedoheptulose 1,7-bisphosphatase-like protein